MNRHNELSRILGASWSEVLEHVNDAVLVLDHERILRFVNEPARLLLGYDEDEPIGGRCKLTTRGVDCENACPLTFALGDKIDRVEGFATIYRTRDGRPVPLRVTVIPLRDDAGAFVGAVEILHPTAPNPGFFLSGSTPAVKALKAQLTRHGRARQHLILVGEVPVCRDVGHAIHRFAGLPDEIFEIWTGTWEDTPAWPPGTMYADGESAASLLESSPPDGWQVVVGTVSAERFAADNGLFETVELPAVTELEEDLTVVVAAWAAQLSPGITVAPQAAQRLARLARDHGFGALERVLITAVAAAESRIDEEHIPADGYDSRLVDEVLQTDNPLTALERRLLTEVLHRSGWRMQEAADRLGVSRVTLWRKCKDHCIERPSGGSR